MINDCPPLPKPAISAPCSLSGRRAAAASNPRTSLSLSLALSVVSVPRRRLGPRVRRRPARRRVPDVNVPDDDPLEAGGRHLPGGGGRLRPADPLAADGLGLAKVASGRATGQVAGRRRAPVLLLLAAVEVPAAEI